MISTYFTGEKFSTGQERFAPWCVHHKRAATPPVENLSRPPVAVGERPAASRRLPDGTASRRAALLTGRSPTAMK